MLDFAAGAGLVWFECGGSDFLARKLVDEGCASFIPVSGSVVGIPTSLTSARRVLMLVSLNSMKSSWMFILACADLYLESMFAWIM